MEIELMRLRGSKVHKGLFWSCHPCNELDNLLKLPLKYILIIIELIPQPLYFLSHDLLSLLMLSQIIVDPFIHSALRLGKPEEHIRVVSHLSNET